MKFKQFANESGFKVLSIAKLSQCEYSTILYLLNCSASGLEELITTISEIASLMGYDEELVAETLDNLEAKKIVKRRTKHTKSSDLESMLLSLEFDVSKWMIDVNKKIISAPDAVVFPFVRHGEACLKIFSGQPKDKEDKRNKLPTWKRVFDAFTENRGLSEDDIQQTEHYSKILMETHPVDQVLLLIRHFGKRIPTLSLLASSWQHFCELLEEETQKVDLLDAKHRHIEMERSLRHNASDTLARADELKLDPEERAVLNILIHHRYPRRQLFWAYQVKGQYPKLANFFEKNASLMLAVTTAGKVVSIKPTDVE